MSTKTITIRAIDIQSGLSNDRDGVPFRWLTSFVDDVRRRVPDDEEESCRVHGAAGLTFTYVHKLTPQEVSDERIAAYEAVAAQIKSVLPRAGEPMTAAQVERVRALLG